MPTPPTGYDRVVGWVHTLLHDEDRAHVEERPPPGWVEPMPTSLADRPFSHLDWLFEPKFDGERVLAFQHDRHLWMQTRYRADAEQFYPELWDALARFHLDDFVVDGEVVALDAGRSSYARLRQRKYLDDPTSGGIDVVYYVFDVLYADGLELRALPLRQRKRILRALFPYQDPVRFTNHRVGSGEAFWREACDRGWEGVIGKHGAEPYGGPTARHWCKLKCTSAQEMVVGGYTEPTRRQHPFGTLVLGYYDRDRLVYAGQVDAGFDPLTADYLARELPAREVDESPFDSPVPAERVHFVRPELVAQVRFRAWTPEGTVHEPTFAGLRDDKPAGLVVREQPAVTPP